MILVIGGYAQGKLEFAKENLGVDSYDDGFIGNSNCIYNLQEAFKDADSREMSEKLEDYIKEHKDCIIICNEIGGGLVPIDKKDREYRENVGRICCKLAKEADSVYRVMCQIGMKIK